MLILYNSALLVLLASAVLVYIDSEKIRRELSLSSGPGGQSSFGWALLVLLFWPVAAPAYLIARGRATGQRDLMYYLALTLVWLVICSIGLGLLGLGWGAVSKAREARRAEEAARVAALQREARERTEAEAEERAKAERAAERQRRLEYEHQMVREMRAAQEQSTQEDLAWAREQSAEAQREQRARRQQARQWHAAHFRDLESFVEDAQRLASRIRRSALKDQQACRQLKELAEKVIPQNLQAFEDERLRGEVESVLVGYRDASRACAANYELGVYAALKRADDAWTSIRIQLVDLGLE